ncbi:MAG TPA: VWA domain-containing protein [Thermoanaerobaculia bacterium]|nr:VWA domain-containing protein [Thermoanaerobaculia bacterium]
MSFRRFLAAGLTAALFAAGATGAPRADQATGAQKPGEKTSQDDGGFFETVNVSVVNVDVYVTDKKGVRVKDLNRNDFEIYEDNRPVAVTNFYAVEDGKSLTPPPAPAQAPPGPVAQAPAPPAIPDLNAVATPEDQRLRLVVYIDNFNIRPFNRNRVMRELRAFVGQKLGRDDQMMLVSYDRSLHVRRTFTSDSHLIATALLELEKVSGQGVHQDSDRRDVLREIEDSKSVNEATMYARSYSQSEFNDLSFSIDAIKDIVDSLAGLPGRKAILYVSDGLQMIAGQDIWYAVQGKYGEQSTGLTEQFQYDASRRFDELTAQANANRITFYTIDAAGLRTFSSVSAENQTAGQPGQGALVDSIEISNLQSPLQMMAEKTGGVAIINSNIVTPQLEKVAADFNSYYSLGYTPTHYGDGRYHKIEVKVKRKGLSVRHREGYRDKNTESRMSDGTLAALRFPFENNPLGVAVELGAATRRSDGFYLQPVLVKIPIGKLVLVPHGATHEGRVRLFIAAVDTEGNTSEVQQVPLPISIPAADLATATAKNYVYTVSLLMRGGDQKVAVGVRDDVAAEASFVSRTVRVGAG